MTTATAVGTGHGASPAQLPSDDERVMIAPRQPIIGSSTPPMPEQTVTWDVETKRAFVLKKIKELESIQSKQSKSQSQAKTFRHIQRIAFVACVVAAIAAVIFFPDIAIAIGLASCSSLPNLGITLGCINGMAVAGTLVFLWALHKRKKIENLVWNFLNTKAPFPLHVRIGQNNCCLWTDQQTIKRLTEPRTITVGQAIALFQHSENDQTKAQNDKEPEDVEQSAAAAAATTELTEQLAAAAAATTELTRAPVSILKKSVKPVQPLPTQRTKKQVSHNAAAPQLKIFHRPTALFQWFVPL